MNTRVNRVPPSVSECTWTENGVNLVAEHAIGDFELAA